MAVYKTTFILARRRGVTKAINISRLRRLFDIAGFHKVVWRPNINPFLGHDYTQVAASSILFRRGSISIDDCDALRRYAAT